MKESLMAIRHKNCGKILSGDYRYLDFRNQTYLKELKGIGFEREKYQSVIFESSTVFFLNDQ
jgi:hypothetical protein